MIRFVHILYSEHTFRDINTGIITNSILSMMENSSHGSIDATC